MLPVGNLLFKRENLKAITTVLGSPETVFFIQLACLGDLMSDLSFTGPDFLSEAILR